MQYKYYVPMNVSESIIISLVHFYLHPCNLDILKTLKMSLKSKSRNTDTANEKMHGKDRKAFRCLLCTFVFNGGSE